ncbi:MAG: oligosaccharide flippase family protein [Planctomycetaceae bacterium]|jgi:O-antigen/teichoic acid export membrane protein|nr:oligosaccharide flippase family protein [Planctomycetaceae bacterium]
METEKRRDEAAEHSGYMKRLMQGTFLHSLNFFIVIFFGLVISRLMIYSLGERYYGIWHFAVAFLGWYGLLDIGLNHSVSWFITKSFSQKDYVHCNIYANTGLAIFLLIGALVCVAALLTGLGTLWLYPKIEDVKMEDVHLLSVVLILTGMSFALDFPIRGLYGISLGAMRHDLAAWGSIIFRTAGALTTYAILSMGGRLVALCLGNMLIAFLQIGVYYIMAKRSFPQLRFSPQNVRRSHVGALFNYSVFGFIASIGELFIFRLDIMVIPILISFEYNASYGTAASFSEHLRSLMITLSNWMTTWLTFLYAKGLYDEIVKTMFFGYKICTYITGFIAFGLLVWCEPFLKCWALTDQAIESGKIHIEYWSDTVPCLIILVIAACIRTVQEPNIRYMYATANHRYYAFSNIVEGALNLGLSIFFVLYCQAGIIGVAWGTLVAAVMMRGLFIPFIVFRLLKKNLLLFYGNMLRLFAKVCLALLPPLFITIKFVAPTYPALFLTGCLSAACYFPAIYFIGFSYEERKQIAAKLLRRKTK